MLRRVFRKRVKCRDDLGLTRRPEGEIIMIRRLITLGALFVGTALCVSACAAQQEPESSDEPTATATSEALTSWDAKWCITHTFGLRFLSHDHWSGSEWQYEVDNINGTPEGHAAAWPNGFCAHGIGVSAYAYGRLYPTQCCAQ
jgi:hypothetical protein